MALFGDVARVADELGREGSRLRKRAAIAQALLEIAALLEVDGVKPKAVPAATAVEAGRFCLYLAGQPFPEADARKLNAGGAILSRALKEVSGASDQALTAAYRRHGDLGAGAYDLLVAPYGKAPAEATLTLSDVAAAFDRMAGARTTGLRSATVQDLLRRATALEAKYLLKLMLGDMRIGVKQSLIEESIAVAASQLGLPADVAEVRHAVMLEANLARAVERAFAGTLTGARLTLFHPLGFMLASPVETPEEAIERFSPKVKKLVEAKPKRKAAKKARGKKLPPDGGADEAENFAEATAGGLPDTIADAHSNAAEDVLAEMERDGSPVLLGEAAEGPDAAALMGDDPGDSPAVHAFLEDKFDGIRAQVHCGDPAYPGRVAIYSRSREDITESFPELEEAFRLVHAQAGEAGGLILDGEILGWDPVANRALPFAVLGQRIGRKRVDDEIRRAIPVAFMAFDLMCDGGELTLTLPLTERRARLERSVERLAPIAVSSLAKVVEAEGGQGTLENLFTAPDGSETEGIADTRRGPIPRLLLSRAEFVESAEAIDRGYTDARARANEGVMIKAAGSPYLPGRRGLLWVKLKRELGSLDVVITGAEFGSGRRSQVLSDYTFAVRGRYSDQGSDQGSGTAPRAAQRGQGVLRCD